MLFDGLPEVTTIPLTLIVAVDEVLVGVTEMVDVPLVTVLVYEVVPPKNDGLSVPLFTVNPDNDETSEILCTTMEYVLVVIVSCAVTTMVIVLSPIFIPIVPELVPLFTVEPFTVIVAPGYDAVGVTVINVTLLIIESVYEVVFLLNVGDNVPLLIVKPDKLASLLVDTSVAE
jgi:hypothetical protein